MYYTRKMERKEERSFTCSKRVNSLSRLTLSFHDIISCSNSSFPLISNSKRPNLMLLSYKIVSPSIASISLVSGFIRVFVPFLCCHVLWSFFEVFVFRCFCCFCLFSLWFSFLAKMLSLAVKMQPLLQPLLN